MEHVEALIKALGAIRAVEEHEESPNTLEAYSRLHAELKRAEDQAIEDAAKDAA